MSQTSPLAAIPASRSDRWSLLQEVASHWYPPLQTADGVPLDELESANRRLGRSLPAALREWYLLAGRRADIWSRQDHVLSPNEFRIQGDHLVFIVENQDVVEWGFRRDEIASDDPPVYVSSVDDRDVWLKENDSLSLFALQWFAYCLKWSNECRWWANACVEADVVAGIVASYPRLPLVVRHWPGPSRFYGHRDIIVEVQGNGDDEHPWLYAVTRTASAAESFKGLMRRFRIEWNAWSDDWPPGWVSASQDLGK